MKSMLALALMVSTASTALATPTLQVRGGSGSAKRIQDAVDACVAQGCTIELPDPNYKMEAQVWIIGHTDLSLVGTGTTQPVLAWEDSLLVPDSSGVAKLFRLKPPTGAGRPDLPAGWLRWPISYSGGVGSLLDTLNPYSSSGFQRNGMLLVENSARIHIENLVLDGQKSAAFYNPSIWNEKYPVLHGSVGISLFHSLAVDVLRCDIRHFWSGLYSNGRNDACAAWGNSGDLSKSKSPIWSNCAKMGGHLIERNRIHDNWWGIYSEIEWDQGSVIRENLAWNNVNQGLRNPAGTVFPKAILSDFDVKAPGGFLFVKDVVFPAHVVTNNTIVETILPYAWSFYNAAPNALWSGNILEVQDTLGGANASLDIHNLLQYGSSQHIWSTALLHHTTATTTTAPAPSKVWVVDSSVSFLAPTPIPRDTVHGVVAGAGFLLVPLDTFEEIVGGKTVHTIDFDTFSVRYDTVIRLTNCARGCTLPLASTAARPATWPNLPLSAVAMRDWSHGLVKAPDSSLQIGRYMDTTVADSSCAIRFPGLDTGVARLQRNRQCRNCQIASWDPSSTSFLQPVWGTTQVEDAIGGDTHEAPRGAIGRDGKLGSHMPVRIRATGLPTYDKTHGQLLLPLSFHSEAGAVSKLIVLRAWVAKRPVTQILYGSGLTPAETRVATGAIAEVEATDSVVHLPFAGPGSDSIVQVDLWMAGISGSDTLAATPMSWAWSANAGGRSFTVGNAARISSQERLKPILVRDQLVLPVSNRAAPTSIMLLDAKGTRIRIRTYLDGNTLVAKLSGVPRGIWFTFIPGFESFSFVRN